MTAALTIPPPSAVAPAEEFSYLPLDVLRESPFNHRKAFDASRLAELADSIRDRGVLTPLLVRPSVDAGTYEIAAGHRRFRAAQAAGLDAVPCRIRPMDDATFLEVLQLENLQREDLSPLEEAEGYADLLSLPGYSAEVIAAKVRKSIGYIYERLRLRTLSRTVREKMAAGDLPVAHALRLARLAPADQEEALRLMLGYAGQVPTLRRLDELLQERFLLQLKRAPFDRDDAALVPAAGACSACPKNSAMTPALFEGLVNAGDARCTDGTCYGQKVAAHVAAARARVVAQTGTKPLLISTEFYVHGTGATGKEKPLGKSEYWPAKKSDPGAKPAVVAHGTGLGRIVYVTTQRPEDERVADPAVHRYRAERLRAEKKAKAERTRRLAIWRACATQAPTALSVVQLQRVLLAFFHQMQQSSLLYLAKALGLEGTKIDAVRRTLGQHVESLQHMSQLYGLLYAMTAVKALDVSPHIVNPDTPLRALADELGVNVQEIEAAAAVEPRAKPAAKGKRQKRDAGATKRRAGDVGREKAKTSPRKGTRFAPEDFEEGED